MTAQSLFTMTPKELQDGAQRLSTLVIDLERMKQNRADAVKEFKADIDALQKSIRSLAREIAEGTIGEEHDELEETEQVSGKSAETTVSIGMENGKGKMEFSQPVPMKELGKLVTKALNNHKNGKKK